MKATIWLSTTICVIPTTHLYTLWLLRIDARKWQYGCSKENVQSAQMMQHHIKMQPSSQWGNDSVPRWASIISFSHISVLMQNIDIHVLVNHKLKLDLYRMRKVTHVLFWRKYQAVLSPSLARSCPHKSWSCQCSTTDWKWPTKLSNYTLT